MMTEEQEAEEHPVLECQHQHQHQQHQQHQQGEQEEQEEQGEQELEDESQATLIADDVAGERAVLQEMRNEIQELENDKSHHRKRLTELKNTKELAELTRTKLADPNATKKGGVKCGVTKGNGTPCDSAGRLDLQLFCGTHKAQATQPSFQVVLEAMGVSSISAALTRVDLRPLDELMKSTENETNRLKAELGELEKKAEKLAKQEKEKKEVVKKLRGPRVGQLYDILEREVQVRFSHRGGDFSMVGNDCRKALAQRDKFLRVLADKKEMHEKYQGLFTRLSSVVETLYRIEPLSLMTLSSAEKEALQPEDALEVPQEILDDGTSDLELEANVIRDLQSFFVNNFPGNPIPKQHLLCFHAVTFLESWLSLGMFAEQAIESLHAQMNSGVKRNRALGAQGAKEKTMQTTNLKFGVNVEALKLKKMSGRKRGPRTAGFGEGNGRKKSKI